MQILLAGSANVLIKEIKDRVKSLAIFLSTCVSLGIQMYCMHMMLYMLYQFYPWFNFDFPLFFSMLIYDNEYQTKENQNWTTTYTSHDWWA